MANTGDDIVQRFTVHARSELRIEIGEREAFVTVTEGTAEIFGAVVQLHRRLRLVHSKIAIFTYDGCSVTLEGMPSESPYTSDDTPMDSYLNASHIINNQRKVAREIRPGPVVVVVGPPCSGKTSLVKILANYAIRAGWNPLLVDTSVEQNLISVPGALAAVQIEVPIEPDEGVVADAPLVFCYGHTDVNHNMDVYTTQVKRLAQLCKARETAYEGRYQNLASGTIIDTAGFQTQMERNVTKTICEAFSADVIMVVGDDKLHSMLRTAFQDKVEMQVIKVPKSGGTVAVSRDQKRIIKDRQIYQYFYGMELDLQPTLHYFSLDKVTICKVATSASAQQGLLPSGMQHSVDGTRLMKMDPSTDMDGHLLGASYSERTGEAVRTSVAGFAWVQRVDLNDRSIALMCPHATPPPTLTFIHCSVKRRLDVTEL